MPVGGCIGRAMSDVRVHVGHPGTTVMRVMMVAWIRARAGSIRCRCRIGMMRSTGTSEPGGAHDALERHAEQEQRENDTAQRMHPRRIPDR